MIAAKKIGAEYLDFDAERSALKKGETLEETLSTLAAQGVDLCILRTSVSEALAPFKDNPPLKIINAGDGVHQHPTQAILDLLTIIEIGFSLQGKTISILGDVRHSRVTHSLIDLLPQYGAKILLCGPEPFLPKEAFPPGFPIEITMNKDGALERADLLYLLRIQNERHHPEEMAGKLFKNYAEDYGVDLEDLRRHRKKIPIFHPGPVNVGVEMSKYLLKAPYYFGYEQVQNSIYARMAIIQAILQNNDHRVGIESLKKSRRAYDLPTL